MFKNGHKKWRNFQQNSLLNGIPSFGLKKGPRARNRPENKPKNWPENQPKNCPELATRWPSSVRLVRSPSRKLEGVAWEGAGCPRSRAPNSLCVPWLLLPLCVSEEADIMQLYSKKIGQTKTLCILLVIYLWSKSFLCTIQLHREIS